MELDGGPGRAGRQQMPQRQVGRVRKVPRLTSRQRWYIFYTEMEFEFDPRKSEGNKRKHGIDFVEAQALWLDVDRIEIPAQTVDEPRTLVIGRIQGQHRSAVVTYREDRIRIISVRRSRREEVEIYEGEGI